MAKPPEKVRRNSFQERADQAGVSIAEFKLWMVEHVRATHQRWSLWNSGDETIPEKYVIAFLRAKLLEREKVPD